MPASTIIHVVVSGETLSGIAASAGITLNELLTANPQIANPNILMVGETVKIPGSVAHVPAPAVPGHGQQYDGIHPAAGTMVHNKAAYNTPPLTNAPGARDPQIYSQVIDQFAVENNPRHLPVPNHGPTYCNIFSWDVTRAMGAEIPHWVIGGAIAVPFDYSHGAQEQTVNATVKWIATHGPANGWNACTETVAVQKARLGHVAVVMWENPNPAEHGHIAIIRPESAVGGPVLEAQAGRHNHNSVDVSTGFPGYTPLRFFWHN